MAHITHWKRNKIHWRSGRRTSIRTLRYVLFFGVLIAALFGSYRNQLGELFPSWTSGSSVSTRVANVRTGPNAAVAPSEQKLPTIVKLGEPATVPADPKLPQVVKPGTDIVGSLGTSIQTSRITVVDGDTIRLDGQSYRLVGIDTPETSPRAKCLAERDKAARATIRLRELVASGDLKLDRVACACPTGTEGTQSCNYGRLCGVLTAGGRNVGQVLVDEGLAKKFSCGSYNCPPKQSWC